MSQHRRLPKFSHGARSDCILAALLLLATFVAYAPALEGEFLLDDDVHVTRPELQSAAGLGRIWSDVGATQQYYPVLHTAFWLEHRLWGDSVRGYHVFNVILHVLAAWLVVALGRRLKLPGAWLAGFVFALHPVAVESVAWISEQKNTLSTVFALGSALVYLAFDDNRRRRSYALATTLFVLALLSKTATVTLPAALLVILWWQHGRLEWRQHIRPLLPWFVAAASAGAITVTVERALLAGIAAESTPTLIDRVLVAARALWFYLLKILWPAELAFFYERWSIDPASVSAWLLVGAPLMAAAVCIRMAPRTRGPLAALLLFVITLLPVLGFVDVEWFVFSFVSDHFQYVAMLAVIVPLTAQAAWWVSGGAAALHRGAAAFAVILVAGLGVMTWRHTATFSNNVALYRNAVARSPRSVVAHNHLGVALAKVPGRTDEAVAAFGSALALNPDAAETHENLGAALLGRPGGVERAIVHLETALRLKPGLARARTLLADAYFDGGKALAAHGDVATAIAQYQLALRTQPRFAEAHYNLGNALLKIPDREAEALPHFEAAVRLRPDFAEAHLNLGVALVRAPNRLPEAIAHFEAALKADPGLAAARNNLARARQLRDPLPAPSTRLDFAALESPVLFAGDAKTAFRDPAAVYVGGEFRLFFTLVRDEGDGAPWMYVATSRSRDLRTWTPLEILTPRDRRLNFSSPGNIVRFGDEWILCLQTYPRPDGEKYGNGQSRIWIRRSRDLATWSPPELLRVKGPGVPEPEMGRMIDPFLLEDKNDPGRWWCFYKQNGVSFSWSRDLVKWTYAGRAAAGENTCVIVVGDEYVMFHSPRDGIGVKRSRDLQHWRDDGLITLGQKDWPWARGRLTAGFVLDLRAEAGVDRYVMFFHGSGPEDEQTMFDHHASIGCAWSDDLRAWHWPPSPGSVPQP